MAYTNGMRIPMTALKRIDTRPPPNDIVPAGKCFDGGTPAQAKALFDAGLAVYGDSEGAVSETPKERVHKPARSVEEIREIMQRRTLREPTPKKSAEEPSNGEGQSDKKSNAGQIGDAKIDLPAVDQKSAEKSTEAPAPTTAPASAPAPTQEEKPAATAPKAPSAPTKKVVAKKPVKRS